MGLHTGARGTNSAALGAIPAPPPFSREGGQLSTPQRPDSKVQLLAAQQGAAGSCTHQCTHADSVCRCSCVFPSTPPLCSPRPSPAVQVRKLKTRGEGGFPQATGRQAAELGGPQSTPTVPQPYSLPFDLHKMLHCLTLSLPLLPHSLTLPPLPGALQMPLEKMGVRVGNGSRGRGKMEREQEDHS